MHKPLYNSRYNYGLGPLDPVLSTKISILRSQLMAAGIWAKLTDVFPLAGGVSTQGLNIRNRTNPLVFTNPDLATFSSLGYSSNAGGYAVCASAPTLYNSLSVYASIPTFSVAAPKDIEGLSTAVPYVASSNSPGAYIAWSGGTQCYSQLLRNTTGIVTTNSSKVSYLGTRLAGDTHRVFLDGALVNSAASVADSTFDINFWSLGVGSSRVYNFLAFGTELSVSDAAVFDQIVKIYRA